MTEVRFQRPANGVLQIYGDASARQLVVIVGRDQFFLDDALVADLIADLTRAGLTVAQYESSESETRRLVDPPSQHGLPWPLRKLVIALRLMIRPSRWGFFLSRNRIRQRSLEARQLELLRLVQQLGPGRHIVFLTRSSGGRVASLMADRAGLFRLICLGYPFHYAQEGTNRDRFRHLPSIRTPFLILQGTRDAYGGRDDLEKYEFSSSTRVEWVETDHHFKVSEADWQFVVRSICRFIESPELPSEVRPGAQSET